MLIGPQAAGPLLLLLLAAARCRLAPCSPTLHRHSSLPALPVCPILSARQLLPAAAFSPLYSPRFHWCPNKAPGQSSTPILCPQHLPPPCTAFLCAPAPVPPHTPALCALYHAPTEHQPGTPFCPARVLRFLAPPGTGSPPTYALDPPASETPYLPTISDRNTIRLALTHQPPPLSPADLCTTQQQDPLPPCRSKRSDCHEAILRTPPVSAPLFWQALLWLPASHPGVLRLSPILVSAHSIPRVAACPACSAHTFACLPVSSLPNAPPCSESCGARLFCCAQPTKAIDTIHPTLPTHLPARVFPYSRSPLTPDCPFLSACTKETCAHTHTHTARFDPPRLCSILCEPSPRFFPASPGGRTLGPLHL